MPSSSSGSGQCVRLDLDAVGAVFDLGGDPRSRRGALGIRVLLRLRQLIFGPDIAALDAQGRRRRC